MDRLAAISATDLVLKLGSFTAAARVLHVTPSAVTKAVTKLEAQLGVKLLDRTTHGLAITDEGRIFHERAQLILDWMSETEELLTERRSEPRGRVRLGTLYGIGRSLIVPRLPAFRERFPGIEIDLTLSDRLPDLISDELDMAIVLGDPPLTSRLVATQIAATRRIVVAAPDYLARCGTPATPADLIRHDCLLHMFDGYPRPWRFADPAQPGRDVEVPVRRVFVTNAGDALRQAAVAGLGLAQSNSPLFRRDLAEGRLIEILGEHASPGLPVYLVRPPLHPIPKRLRVVGDFLKELFA